MSTLTPRYSAREAAVLAARLAAMRERLAELHATDPDSILIEPLERCIPDLADTVAAMRTSIDFAGAISEDEDRARVIANETAEAETLGRLLAAGKLTGRPAISVIVDGEDADLELVHQAALRRLERLRFEQAARRPATPPAPIAEHRTPRRSAPRARRAHAQAGRSGARSGDSPDGDPDPEPAPAPGGALTRPQAGIAALILGLDRTAHGLVNEPMARALGVDR